MEQEISKYVKISVSMPDIILTELDEFCKGAGYSRSGAIAEAVRRLIKKEKG